jgi:tetratricopeptide (TPR) repeat protein
VLTQGYSLLHRVGDIAGQAHALRGLAMATLETGDLAAADSHLRNVEVLQHRLGDASALAWTEHDRARLALDAERPDDAARLFAASLDRFRQLGQELGAAWAINGLGRAQAALGHPAAAAASFEAALAAFRRLEHPRGTAWSLYNLAWLRTEDDPRQSWSMLAEALTLFRSLAYEAGIAASVVAAARLLVELDPGTGALWLGMVAATPPCSAVDARRSDRVTESVRARLGAFRFNAAWARGAALDATERDAAVTALLEPRGLALAA